MLPEGQLDSRLRRFPGSARFSLLPVVLLGRLTRLFTRGVSLCPTSAFLRLGLTQPCRMAPLVAAESPRVSTMAGESLSEISAYLLFAAYEEVGLADR